MQHIFIIGSRGLPAQYGGFETFVAELVTRQQSTALTYHVACLSNDQHQTHFTYEGVDCFTINPPKLGPARVIAYDMMALTYALKMVDAQQLSAPIFYILGNTIGAFIKPFAKQIHAVGGQLFVNPDGLEWRRSKWSRPVQTYLKLAEKAMTRYADLIVADNQGIETYLKQAYPWVKTTFIAYGTDVERTPLTAETPRVRQFFDKWQSVEGQYYLLVGRFVPENNYETVIREFMQTSSQRDLMIICNHEGQAYFDCLRQRTQFDRDARIKFVGTVYDRDLLVYLRQQAFAYIHGHEVGGTNPGLLEALSQTDRNLVLDVEFNRTVAADTALYWDKTPGCLAQEIEGIDGQAFGAAQELGAKAKARMQALYSWDKIIQSYETLFSGEKDESKNEACATKDQA